MLAYYSHFHYKAMRSNEAGPGAHARDDQTSKVGWEYCHLLLRSWRDSQEVKLIGLGQSKTSCQDLALMEMGCQSRLLLGRPYTSLRYPDQNHLTGKSEKHMR